MCGRTPTCQENSGRRGTGKARQATETKPKSPAGRVQQGLLSRRTRPTACASPVGACRQVERRPGPAEEGADEKETDNRPKMGSGGHAVETAVPKADSRFLLEGSFWRRSKSFSASQLFSKALISWNLCLRSTLISGENKQTNQPKNGVCAGLGTPSLDVFGTSSFQGRL